MVPSSTSIVVLYYRGIKKKKRPMREKGCSLSIILLKLYYFVATTIVRTNTRTRTGDGRIVVRMILKASTPFAYRTEKVLTYM